MAATKKVRGVCTVSGCGRPHKARGWCLQHYMHFLRGVPIKAEIKTRDRAPKERCSVEGCIMQVKAKGFCQMHYARFLKHGNLEMPTRAQPRKGCLVHGCDGWMYAGGMCQQHYARNRLYLQKYGVTLMEVDAMWEAQGCVCACCGELPKNTDYRNNETGCPVVDHCHQSGKIRGILCDHCNRGIGLLGDTPEALERAAAYLRKVTSTP